jgi:hypothetical protein
MMIKKVAKGENKKRAGDRRSRRTTLVPEIASIYSHTIAREKADPEKKSRAQG